MNKVFSNAQDAIKDIEDGHVLMLGGFGLCGIPENCIAALVKKGVKNLTCIANNAGVDDFGIGLMLQKKQVKMLNGLIKTAYLILTILLLIKANMNYMYMIMKDGMQHTPSFLAVRTLVIR